MERMTGQTKIIVATACCLALVDIAVRTMTTAHVSDSGVVTARAVRLVDGNGNVRGLWNTDEKGEPALWMYDRNGATRIELDTTKNTPSLSLHDTDGNRRVYFGMDNRDGRGLFQTIEDSKIVTFSFDGSGSQSHFGMNDDGSFTEHQKLETGPALDGPALDGPALDEMRGTIFAKGVHPVVEDAGNDRMPPSH